MVKAVKQFTLNREKNCRGTLYEGDKCCITGAFLRACGVKPDDMQGQDEPDDVESDMTLQLANAYSVDEFFMDEIIRDAIQVNDKAKQNWQRRIAKFRKIFQKIGVKVIVK